MESINLSLSHTHTHSLSLSPLLLLLLLVFNPPPPPHRRTCVVVFLFAKEYLGAADTSLAYECLRDAVKQGKSEERQRFMLNDLLGVKKATYFAPILQKLMALRFGKQVSY